MLQPGSKPRVFLSHSSANKPFIEKVHSDLLRCQVSPWMDSIDIRHGQPWLDAIFQHGIAACDAIIVYLTEDSLKSDLVKKEIDAGIIATLRDKRVAFLPYVSKGEIRPRLRPDLQALQSLEWNEANYSVVLPQVIAELWHSYVDRVVVAATNEERMRRLSAELELERVRQSRPDEIFSTFEDRDFAFIWAAFDRYEPIGLKRVTTSTKEVTLYHAEIHVGSFVPLLSRYSHSEYDQSRLVHQITKELGDLIPASPEPIMTFPGSIPNLSDELKMYGLLSTISAAESTSSKPGRMRSVAHLAYTDKYDRLRYWLAVKGRLPNAPVFRLK